MGFRRIFLALAGLVAGSALVGVVGVWVISEGLSGERHARGEIARRPIPQAAVRARAERQSAAVPDEPDEAQILFGDLHVHTTYSGDAFVFSLPLLQGEGVHPPADACDFARFCAELDFFSLNDHAESITPWQWDETKRSVRECNAVAGDPANPDLVAYLGWEWTQSSPDAMSSEESPPNYGHKNVIFLDTEEDHVPRRPIGAGAGGLFGRVEVPAAAWAIVRTGMTLGDWPGGLGPYLDFNRFTRDVRAMDACSPDVPVRDLPDDCLEGAETPAALFAKLDDWGFPSLVIPHGTTWGIHAPRGSELGIQLAPGGHDPARQRLFEVYSGHGNSELWRSLRDTIIDENGSESCAPPTDGYLPCCWRAGEIIGERCGDAPAAPCAERVSRARQTFVDAGPGPVAFEVVPGTRPDDWLECGQLADSFLPALDYRPGMSAQYGLAVRDPEAGPEAGAFRFGLIASSDNHKARAGPGYKEIHRKAFGDAYGLRQDWLDAIASAPATASSEPVPLEELRFDPSRLDPGTERNASYYYTSGLVAVHSTGRDRRSIWDALESRHVYGTSGPRILLWFDLRNGADGPAPMGSEASVARLDGSSSPPRFRVRAVGAFEQKPGCPEHTRERLSPERLQRLCLGECYHPGDARIPIDRIEVVRIRPQQSRDEPVAGLIEDPWMTFVCDGSPVGCAVEFEDPEYTGEREFVYYVRALQVPTPAVNGDPMRCRRDADGRCLEARLCPAGGPEFDPEDDCLSPVRERAWSSPIFLRP